MLRRREWIGLVGGAAAGVACSPIPWKLLDDTAIWTQNWPWTPTPVKGVLSEKPGLCTLCGAGCGLKARCVGANVYGLAPVAGGALCPIVYGAHQLPDLPMRLRTGILHGREVPANDALAAAVQRIEAVRAIKGRIALLDERPGRIQSALYTQLAKRLGGTVVTLSQVEDRTLRAMEELARLTPGTLGYDFEHAGVILSVGAPLLDSWGAAGRMSRLWASRRGPARPVFVHAGSRWSRGAQLADRTMLLRPGAEGAFVAALAGKLPLEEAARHTGLATSSLTDLALQLRERAPAIVVGGGEAASSGLPEDVERMIAALNFSLGSVGREGGIVARRQTPPLPGLLERIDDRSLDLLVHDASTSGVVVPEALLRRKLASGGTLVRLIAYRPERIAPEDIVVPSTAFLESGDDSSGPRDASATSWTYAEALKPPPEGLVSPQAFVAALGANLESYEALRDAKAAAIVSAKRGRLIRHSDGEAAPFDDLESFRKTMDEGAVWIDESAPQTPFTADLSAVDWSVRQPFEGELIASAVGVRGSMSALPAPPLASKLDRETRLLAVPGEVRLHPRTAQALQLKTGDAVSVETAHGEANGKVRCDPAVLPGQVELAACGDNRQAVLEAMGSPSPARIRRS